MSGDVSDRKRLISITAGNLRNHHIYLSGHHDFFPKAAYGSSHRAGGIGKPIRIEADGFKVPVITDIATNGANGSPRNFFRKRAWIRHFFA